MRGALVMKGYWNDPEATARALADGWLHTGDIGEIDADGYIRITDRKRDFIKNSGGDMVSPARVEGYLTLQPEIGQAMVYGDRRPYLVAVIVPDAEFLDGFATRRGTRPELSALAGHSELQRRSAPPSPASTPSSRRSSACAASSSPATPSPPPTAR